MHKEWWEESRRLEARLAEAKEEASYLKTKAANLQKAPQAEAPQAEAGADQLSNSLQILTCLKDVMMPYHSLLLPKDPNAMTREQKIVYHFLNEVQAATVRQTPLVQPREAPAWRP